ncbi:DnaJ domain-containing protein [Candidatus Poribacteria bacterium]|nr:DnaJ domain-containing protein [Candidatus Poribacteria bacterium]
MIGNFAFLINKNKFEDFNRKIEELNCEFNEKLNFKIIGPLPTYNFYTFEIKKIQFEEIDWCRKTLGLDVTATKEEIRKAHQMKAFLTHPDRNPDKENIAGEFDEGTRAYKTISAYCQGDFCSFIKEDFEKNSIIVNLCE